LVIFAVSFFTPFLLFFPETCRKIVGNGSIPPPPLNHNLTTLLRERRLKKEGRIELFMQRDRLAKDRHIGFPNPMNTLRIIFTKTAGLTLIAMGVLFSCYYAVTSSLPSQFQEHYGLNDLEISLMFLPFGAGGILSAFTTGRLVDWNFRRHARRLGVVVDRSKQRDLIDFPIERARMEVAVPAITTGAAGLLCYGWIVAKGVHIAAPCVFLFIVGYSITAAFNCINILMVDIYPGKPATATAANNLVRCWMGAGSAALVIPLTENVGFGWTATIAVGIWLTVTPALVIVQKYGPRWRREAKDSQEKSEEQK